MWTHKVLEKGGGRSRALYVHEVGRGRDRLVTSPPRARMCEYGIRTGHESNEEIGISFSCLVNRVLLHAGKYRASPLPSPLQSPRCPPALNLRLESSLGKY